MAKGHARGCVLNLRFGDPPKDHSLGTGAPHTGRARTPGQCVFKVRDVHQLIQLGSDPGGGHHNVSHLQDEETSQDPGY